MKKILISSAFALAAFAGSASAHEVMATVESAGKAGRGIAIDIVSDGGIAGFSFRIEVPGINEKTANVKGCTAKLVGFTGECAVSKGGINVIASANAPATTIQKGVVSVGEIYFTTSDAKAAGGIQITGAEFSDNSGNSTAGTAKVVQN